MPVSRSTLLAAASAIGVAAGLLSVAAGAFYLADGVSNSYPTALSVSDGFYVLGTVLVIAGFAAAFIGFRRTPASSRRRLLGLGGNCFSATGAALLAAYVIRSIEYGQHNVLGTFTASSVVEAVSSAALVAAGASVALAFLSARAGHTSDNGLGSAGIALAVFFGLGVASTVLGVIAYSDYHAPGGITGGLAIEAVGDAVAAGGAVIAGVAFLSSARDVLLAIAATVLGVGFVLFAIGASVYAGADSSVGADGKTVAADWLSAVSWLGLAAAAICAGAGFRARSAPPS